MFLWLRRKLADLKKISSKDYKGLIKVGEGFPTISYKCKYCKRWIRDPPKVINKEYFCRICKKKIEPD